jgi:hypothetical protein
MSDRDDLLDAVAFVEAVVRHDRDAANAILGACDNRAVLLIIARMAAGWVKDGCDAAGMPVEEELAHMRTWFEAEAARTQ